MSKKQIEPTNSMVGGVELAQKLMQMDIRAILRAALNHPDAAGLFECDHTDYVHVDEAATRVEAAREQGWDDAAQHIYNKGWEGVGALRKANPHRTVQELPTKPGTVIVPAEGHEYIEAEVGGIAHRAREAVLGANGWWYGAWRKAEGDGLLSAMFPKHISAPTWKVDDQ